jgi:hypothetical protein
MATSPAGVLDAHDWKRVLETAAQGLITAVLTYLLTFLPVVQWGKYEPIAALVIYILTEVVKRRSQGATL